MSVLEWILIIILFTLYLSCLFTVCALTFRKGHTVLGIIGIVFPILWLIGAMLPAKRGSRYAIEEGVRQAAVVEQYTR